MAPVIQILTSLLVLGRIQTSAASPSLSTTGQIKGLEVDLGYEVYKGFYNESFKLNSWQGIRYAAPPTGSNRWQPPITPATNRGSVIQANTVPPRCPQGPQSPIVATYNYTGSEDCLFLSVYAPENAADLPVFLWIHGGGYGGGQGNQDIGNITRINKNSFVSVVIQYRLGAFGFLSSDEVKRFGTPNAGLLDQHFSLQWVQNYVHLFGGDPRRVTIAGESAGGGSVMLQAMAYGGALGTSLFETVIAASPFLPMQYGYSDWKPSQSYYALAEAVGCFPNRGYGSSNTTIIDCLRQVPSDTLQNASAHVGASGTWGTWAFLPVTDGDFIRSRPSVQLLTGKVNGMRVLSGNNANEGAAFVITNLNTTADFEAWLKLEYPLLTPNDVELVLNKYYPNNDPTDPAAPVFATCGDCPGPTALSIGSVANGQQQRAINLYSETTFVCPSYWLASAYGPSAGKQAYKYQYSIPAGQHGADLSAEGLRAATANVAPQFYTAMTTMWGNMIAGGNPSIPSALANGNAANLTANAAGDWPAFATRGSGSGSGGWRMLNLNETGGEEYSAHVVAYPARNATQYRGPGLENDIREVDAYSWEGGRGERCQFWASIGARVPE